MNGKPRNRLPRLFNKNTPKGRKDPQRPLEILTHTSNDAGKGQNWLISVKVTHTHADTLFPVYRIPLIKNFKKAGHR